MIQPKIVTLRPEEFGMAIEIAKNRQVESLLSNRTDPMSSKSWRDGFAIHLHGATSEIAVAKLLNRYPMMSVNQFSGMLPDVGGNIEVRHSTMAQPHLVVRSKDPEDRIYVLTYGSPPDISVAGWLLGKNAKSMNQFHRDPNNMGRPAWFIPVDYLMGMDELPTN